MPDNEAVTERQGLGTYIYVEYGYLVYTEGVYEFVDCVTPKGKILREHTRALVGSRTTKFRIVDEEPRCALHVAPLMDDSGVRWKVGWERTWESRGVEEPKAWEPKGRSI